MKIHEYQGKQIFAQHGVPIPKGRVAKDAADAKAIATELGGKVVVKAQIHAGGRGKGGGVKLANSPDEAATVFGQIHGMQLITHQTGPAGQKVKTVLVEEQMPIDRELYLALLIDGASGMPVMMASSAGGMDIEEVAAKTPEAIHRVSIDPVTGFQPHLARELCFALDLKGDEQKQAIKLMSGLYEAFIATDASLAEVNPLVTTKDGRVLALDAKMNFDDNALFRHPDVEALRDKDEEDPSEVEAEEKGINNFIKLDGDIGCLVNGAGLAMATMDSIKFAGGEPANFLDIATANDVNKVIDALLIISRDENVKAILVNIFGGMARVDIIAEGIIGAQKQMTRTIPVVARLAGTNVEEGKRLIEESGLPVIRAEDLGDAATKAVAAAKAA